MFKLSAIQGDFRAIQVGRFNSANTLTAVIPKILAQGLMALRGATVMPSLVNSDYGMDARQKGSTVDVPIPSAVTVRDVVPGVSAVQAGDSSPVLAQLPLNYWREAPFYLTDKDTMEAVEGVIPMQASEAIKALAQDINTKIFANYVSIYGYVAPTGTNPFDTDTQDATLVRKVLNNQLAPLDDMRQFVVDPDAEANLLNLRAFQDTNFAVTADDVRNGNMARKLGFNWAMDQQVPTHTSTALSAGALTVNGAHAVGVTTVSLAKATNPSDLVVGDLIQFANDLTRWYVVTANVTLIVGNTDVGIQPPLVVALAGGEAVTLVASHVVNLGFHRDCFAFASRPMLDIAGNELGSIIQAAVDPVSGLTLRLEVTRQHKQINWSYDILYGSVCVRPALGCRLGG